MYSVQQQKKLSLWVTGSSLTTPAAPPAHLSGRMGAFSSTLRAPCHPPPHCPALVLYSENRSHQLEPFHLLLLAWGAAPFVWPLPIRCLLHPWTDEPESSLDPFRVGLHLLTFCPTGVQLKDWRELGRWPQACNPRGLRQEDYLRPVVQTCQAT